MPHTLSLFDPGHSNLTPLYASWRTLRDTTIRPEYDAELPAATQGLRAAVLQAVRDDWENVLPLMAATLLREFRSTHSAVHFDLASGRDQYVTMNALPEEWQVRDLIQLTLAQPGYRHHWENPRTAWLAERWRDLFSDAVFTWLTTTTDVETACTALRTVQVAAVSEGWETVEQDALARLVDAVPLHQVSGWYTLDPRIADTVMRRIPTELDEYGDLFWISADAWADETLAALEGFSLRDLVALGDPVVRRWADEARQHADAARREADLRREQVRPQLTPLIDGVRAAARADLGYPLPSDALGRGHIGRWVRAWLFHHAPPETPWSDLPLIAPGTEALARQLMTATRRTTPPPAAFAVEATIVLALAHEHDLEVASPKTPEWRAAFFACLRRHGWSDAQLTAFASHTPWLSKRLRGPILDGSWRTRMR